MRAELVSKEEDWPWGSARADLAARDDQLVKVAPLPAMIGNWDAFLNSAMPEEELGDIRHPTRTGRVLKPQNRGPKPKHKVN